MNRGKEIKNFAYCRPHDLEVCPMDLADITNARLSISEVSHGDFYFRLKVVIRGDRIRYRERSLLPRINIL